MGSFCISPGAVLAKGIWAVNKLLELFRREKYDDLEYLYATVKPDIVCSICKNL